uniref:GCS light chain n=1 Tax=Timema genevievae TaxID=629358 RepID=A0A7R9JT57_TIMGE|nr:unnamed protein product [Timema genevievae]
MLTKVPHNVNTICVHTGNILNLNELKIKAGQNPTDELIESLKITLSSWQPKNDGVGQHLQIRRTEGSPMSQLENEDRSGLKVSVKVFISSLKKEALHESLDSMFSTLDMEYIDSLVLAYPSKSESSLLLAALKELWQILEDYVERKKLHSIGVSDVDTEVFIALYDWAKIKPSIIQINLAT